MAQYIFMDESGDLGFNPNKKNSRYFIVTIVFAKGKKPLERIVKKTHQSLRKNIKKMSGGVLHAVKEKPATRRKLLSQLPEHGCSIMAIYLNKANVYTHLQDEKHVLYNYVTNILLDRIMKKNFIDSTEQIVLVAERRETNKFINLNFSNYLENQIKQKHKLDLSVSIKTPSEEKVLQLVDFISWSIFRKYERKDKSYYDIFKTKLVEESGLFS